ncbi:ECF transporter S component [Aminipila butyrica]|uniref:Riboflavin transporter n=1 Tax=Aminipila butyrica TaxID=433296 RepID=A0A858BWU8_9FIRM|nr:ECF transporter S component [Aminipila butyrica]QIB70413.1 ECF transporter S component [Aminipila butyrica]
MTAQNKTVKLAKMGMLVAISVVLVYLVHFPIFPAVAFMEYDPADIPIFIGTFAFGPMAGLLLTVVTAVLQGTTVSAGSGIYGIIMHTLATGSFVLASGFIYRGRKGKKEAALALTVGVLVMTVVMVGANLVITPIFTGWPVSAVKDVMGFIVGFNVVKAGLNAVITFFLYKRISGFLHR